MIKAEPNKNWEDLTFGWKDITVETLHTYLRHIDVDARDFNEWTMLMCAAWYGSSFEVIQILLDKGSDVNAKGNDGRTPLMLASICGDIKIVQMFIDIGADVNAQDRNGFTALHNAISCITKNNDETIQLLIDNGADVNSQDITGCTVLGWTLKFMSFDKQALQLLIDNGAIT